jgi:hypothetical protein
MNNDDIKTPEQFLIEINIIDASANLVVPTSATASAQYKNYFDQLTDIKKQIQTQIDNIVEEKPKKSQQLLQDFKDIYDTTYITNFCLFLGICLIIWYIVKPNNNNSNVTQNN